MLAILVAALLLTPLSSKADRPVADDVYITVLSDMVASNARSTPPRSTHAEWGFAALVEVKTGGRWHQLLFDSGADPATVLYNAGGVADRKGGLGIVRFGGEKLFEDGKGLFVISGGL